jgi:plastocyanin
MKRLATSLAIVALAAVTAACSGSAAATGTPTAPAPSGSSGSGGDAIVIVAKDLKFDKTALTVAADEPVEIVLDNQESVPHNIAISDASGASVFKGEIVTGAQVTNAVPALAAGTYTFICEVHPDMKGTITAA